jgi:glyoxylase-like metal-dependent hydrolase (beta-lactamase superfamily II)
MQDFRSEWARWSISERVQAGQSRARSFRDVPFPKSRPSAFFLALVSPNFREDMTAIREIQKLGFNPRDVLDIVLTRLEFDHAGGLDDFPARTSARADRACPLQLLARLHRPHSNARLQIAGLSRFSP